MDDDLLAEVGGLGSGEPVWSVETASAAGLPVLKKLAQFYSFPG